MGDLADRADKAHAVKVMRALELQFAWMAEDAKREQGRDELVKVAK